MPIEGAVLNTQKWYHAVAKRQKCKNWLMFDSPIVSVDQLQAAITNPATGPTLVICDVRAYLDGRQGRDAFASGHLPGARFIDLDTVLAADPAAVLGRHPLPDPEVFAREMSAAGIGHDTPVVAYDDSGGMIAGRLVWMLRVLGQPAALLDGGIDAWTGDLTSEAETPREVAHPPRIWPLNATVDADEVEVIIADGGLVIDSRAPARYRGEVEPIDAKAGHVPGAINLPFSENLVDGRFRSTEELKQRFDDVGVTENTVWYCGSGVSACHNLLAAEAAGLGMGKLYVGSWSGWSSEEARVVEVG